MHCDEKRISVGLRRNYNYKPNFGSHLSTACGIPFLRNLCISTQSFTGQLEDVTWTTQVNKTTILEKKVEDRSSRLNKFKIQIVIFFVKLIPLLFITC